MGVDFGPVAEPVPVAVGGEGIGEVVGAQVVSVPMSVPIKHAEDAFKTFMGTLAGVFVFIVVVLVLIFRQLRWVVLPLVSCAYAGVAMLGLLGLVGWEVTVITRCRSSSSGSPSCGCDTTNRST